MQAPPGSRGVITHTPWRMHRRGTACSCTRICRPSVSTPLCCGHQQMGACAQVQQPLSAAAWSRLLPQPRQCQWHSSGAAACIGHTRLHTVTLAHLRASSKKSDPVDFSASSKVVVTLALCEALAQKGHRTLIFCDRIDMLNIMQVRLDLACSACTAVHAYQQPEGPGKKQAATHCAIYTAAVDTRPPCRRRCSPWASSAAGWTAAPPTATPSSRHSSVGRHRSSCCPSRSVRHSHVLSSTASCGCQRGVGPALHAGGPPWPRASCHRLGRTA